VSERPSTSTVAPTVTVAAGTTALAALLEAGAQLNGPGGAVVVRAADGVLHDLDWVPEQDEDIEPVAASSPDGLAVIRHSAAHVMAQAVQDLFPGTQLGIGPPIENGFYYDFNPARPFQPEDLTAIEARMQADHQRRTTLLPPPDRGRRGADRAGRRTVQARAHRAQGRCVRGGVGRGRRCRADDV